MSCHSTDSWSFTDTVAEMCIARVGLHPGPPVSNCHGPAKSIDCAHKYGAAVPPADFHHPRHHDGRPHDPGRRGVGALGAYAGAVGGGGCLARRGRHPPPPPPPRGRHDAAPPPPPRPPPAPP